MLIETTQLKEKLEDEFKKKMVNQNLIKLDDMNIFYENMNYLYYLQRVEELFIKYFMSEEK